MTKYWKTTIQKNGSDMNLYVGTSEEGIRRDRAAGSSGSLITSAQQFNSRSNPSEDTDHLDLATGAFSLFMRGKGFTQSDTRIYEVSLIPSGLGKSHLGGSDGNIAVTLYYE